MTNKFPKPDLPSLIKFYGNPDTNGDGKPDPIWEARNIIRITPPYPMFWSWNEAQSVRSIALNKACAKEFLAALTDVGAAFNSDQRKILQLDQCGGAYNFRVKRTNSKSLSLHAYGAAIDLAPEVNWLGRKYDHRLGMMPFRVVEIFARYGIKWGGRWNTPDCMHFEATS
jgi:hypothetical protein